MTPGRLPRAEQATLAPEKVHAYLLAPEHPDNKGRALFFHRFGFARDEWPTLASALIAHPARNAVTRVATAGLGTRYRVQCTLVTPDRRNPCIITVWLVESGEPPRLVTAFPGPAQRTGTPMP